MAWLSQPRPQVCLTESRNAAEACGLTLTDVSRGRCLWAGNPMAFSTNLHLAPFYTLKNEMKNVSVHVHTRRHARWQESLLFFYRVGSGD